MKIKNWGEKKIVYKHFLRDKKISLVSCEEDIVYHFQKSVGDIYELRYLGVDSEYNFYLALEKEKVLGYAITQKYFENYYLRENKGKRRGEPALIYSLERKKGIGSLLFLTSSLEILKDDKVEVFRCEAVYNNVIDKLCSKLGLDLVGTKNIFNVYELILEKCNRECLEEKIKEQLISL